MIILGFPQQWDGRRSFKIILYDKRSESSSSKKRGNSMECHGCVVTHFISSYLFFPLLGQESREHVIDVDPGEAGDWRIQRLEVTDIRRHFTSFTWGWCGCYWGWHVFDWLSDGRIGNNSSQTFIPNQISQRWEVQRVIATHPIR